jgi:hypothetical protein
MTAGLRLRQLEVTTPGVPSAGWHSHAVAPEIDDDAGFFHVSFGTQDSGEAGSEPGSGYGGAGDVAHPRRIGGFGPYAITAPAEFVLGGLEAGDVIVYAMSGVGGVGGPYLTGAYGADWSSIVSLGDFNEMRAVGAFLIHTDGVQNFGVDGATLVAGYPTIVVGSVYRSPSYSGQWEHDYDASGEFPDIEYNSPDGVSLVVRAAAYTATTPDPDAFQFLQATKQRGGALDEIPSYTYCAVVAIGDRYVPGPPTGPDGYVASNLGGGGIQKVTIMLRSGYLPDEVPDPDNHAPVGMSRIPTAIFPG